MDIYHQHPEMQVFIMKLFVARFAVLMMIAVLGSSCSTLTASSAVKASFDSEEDSWLAKKIPAVKSLSNMIPPPSEARLKWDQYNQGKRNENSKAEDL